MGIMFDAQQRIFHLQGRDISYLLTILPNEQLGQIYFGQKIRHYDQLATGLRWATRGYLACVFEGDLAFSLEYTPQEYPAYGKTDFRHPAYQVQNAAGHTISDLRYVSHAILPGKPRLAGLPATYVEQDDEAATLEITLRDAVSGLTAVLSYTVYAERNVITRSARFENGGAQDVRLLRALSMCLDLPDADFEMMQLSGAWARERHLYTRPLTPGIQAIESTRGASSAHQNPFIALKRPHTTETHGEVYGFSLVYSGNFLAEVEVNHDHQTRVMLGINPFDFSWLLTPGETFQTPEVVLVYSNQGLEGMSQTYHDLYRRRLARGVWRDRERPILLNNWEATFFDFNEEKILTLARAAKDLGIELVVLDDGWFGHRDDDRSSLGDWVTHPEKLPRGLKFLAQEIEAFGLRFGLWFEPEMISKDSALYRDHPEWLLQVPEYDLSHGRNQFVLDFTRPEAREAIYQMVAAILADAPISYVKWDMNRNMTEIGSLALPPERQKETAHRYMLGVYAVMERLTQAFPEVLFESCAGGGGRFDPGLLYYMPQAWASDDTDAIERLKIQAGTSLVYPVSAMGAHVSAVPNHQVGRFTPLMTRANVAFFGAFGYELDITQLPAAERAAIQAQTAYYQAHRQTFQFGTFYRLSSPFEQNHTCWLTVAADEREAILVYVKTLAAPNAPFRAIRLRGLLPAAAYVVEETGQVFYGDDLMYRGFPLPAETGQDGDFTSSRWTFQRRAES